MKARAQRRMLGERTWAPFPLMCDVLTARAFLAPAFNSWDSRSAAELHLMARIPNRCPSLGDLLDKIDPRHRRETASRLRRSAGYGVRMILKMIPAAALEGVPRNKACNVCI